MFSLVDFFFVSNFAKVVDVGEQFEQRALVKVSAATLFAFLGDVKFVPPIASFDFLERDHISGWRREAGGGSEANRIFPSGSGLSPPFLV